MMLRLRTVSLAAILMAAGGCAHTTSQVGRTETADLCQTERLVISTDFSGAGQHGCALSPEGPVLTVWPEAATAGPINPSPWYAFEATVRDSGPVSLRLDYGAHAHRYHPWMSLDHGATWQKLPDDAVEVGEEGHIATLTLPAGQDEMLVAGRPFLTPADMETWNTSLAGRFDMEQITYGESLDQRPLRALAAGDPGASRVVVILTGQHPPEQSGAAAFMAFSEALMKDMPEERLTDTRFVFLPLVNPDGRARGHWRHNNGGLDLNRDWLNQTQPEIQAATRLILSETEGKETVAFMDFHSTNRTLVYTQPLDSEYSDMTFPHALKAAFDEAIDPDPEWIAGHNAEAGTSKNWSLQSLDVAGLTIELADDAPEAEIETVGRVTARTLLEYLSTL